MQQSFAWVKGSLIQLVSVAFAAFAIHFTATADGFGLFTGTLFRGFLEIATKFHLAEETFALHFLFQNAQSLIYIVIAYVYTDHSASLHSNVKS